MKFEDRQEFNKPWEVVQKMFTDAAYFEKKAKMLKRMNVQMLAQEKKGNEFKIRFGFDDKATIEMPGFAQRFAGKTAHVIEETRWNIKTRSGSLIFEFPSLPVKVRADMKVTDTDKGCVNVLGWNVSCSVLLIGGKLEKLIAQDIQTKAVEDLAASRSLLKKY